MTTIATLIKQLKELQKKHDPHMRVWVMNDDGEFRLPFFAVRCDIDGKVDSLHIEPLGQDCCPECGTEIEVSDNRDGTFAIYCPNCGPVERIAEITELDNSHYLGYPESGWWGHTCPDCHADLEAKVRDAHQYFWCSECMRVVSWKELK